MKKIWVVITLIIVVALVIVFVVAKTKKEPGEIKIGVIAPLTGDGALYGVPPVRAIRLAVDEINSAGGIDGKRVKLIIEDSRGNSQTGINAANKLILSDKVKVIIGEIYSSITNAIALIANNYRVLLFSPQSAAPYLSSAGDYVFRNWPSSEKEGEAAAELSANKLGMKRASVVYINNDYGVGVKTVFEKKYKELGGDIVLEDGVNEGTADLRSIITKVKAANADLLYLAMYLREGALFLVQAKEMGLRIQIVAPDSMHNNELFAIAGKACEGIIVTTVAYDPESPQKNVVLFVNKFKKAFGIVPNNYAAHGYDAMMIIAQAIQHVGYNADKIRDYLYNLKDYPGVSGDTSFDRNGDVIKPIIITIIKQGQFQDYEQ